MKLGLTYHNDFRFSESHHAYDEGFKLWQRAENQISTEVLPPAPHPFRLVSPKPLSMDPTLSRDVGSGILFTNLFSGLVELNLEMEIVPDVANRWEVLDSGLRYVFYLDEKRIWSDGIPLTAHDFEYAWKRALDPEGWAKHWGSAKRLFAIKNAEAYMQGNLPDSSAVGVHARGDYTLEVELERPYSPFLYVMSIESSFPVPRHVVEIEGDTWADPDKLVTNGPFRVVEWHPGEFALLGRDPLYTGSFPGNLDQVEVIFRFGEVNRMDLYQDDRIDIAAIDDPDQYHLLRSKYAEELRMISSLQTQFVGFNLKKPPFDDPRIRKAFVMAVDRDHFAQTTSDLGGIFLPAKGGFLPPGMPGYQSGIALHYDPAQARNLLASAGFPDGRGFPRVDGFVSYFTSHAQNMGFQWRKNLGIEVRWVEMPRVKFFEQVGGRDELHLWSYGYGADFPDPDEILRAGMLQQTGWVNHEFQEILNCAAALTDYTERIRLYQKAEQIIVDESPVFPIGYSKPEFFVKPWVRKFSTSPIRGGYWKYLILEPH
jgi:oligopeptide transport system substrate-binding protein